MITFSSLFESILQASLGASLLIILILLIRFALQRWLPMWSLYLFSVAVIIRLGLPVFPPSELSLLKAPIETASEHDLNLSESSRESKEHGSPSVGAVTVISTNRFEVFEFAAGIWAGGAVFLVVYQFVSYFRFRRWLLRQPETSDPNLLQLIDACVRRTGIRRDVAVHLVDSISTPAVFGVLTPHILLPKPLVSELDPADLKHILLHEMSHIRRRDVLAGGVTAIVGAVHWFNPLVWIVIRIFSTDRELLCDGAVLKTLGDVPKRRHAYGETLLRLLRRRSFSLRQSPGLVPFINNKKEIKKRITMIAKPTKKHWLSPLLACAALIAVALVTFTVAAPAEEQGEKKEHSENEGRGEKTEGREHGSRERGEHDRDGEGHPKHGDEGEESGKELKLGQKYDNTRNGARLILAYDSKSNSFKGTVQNTTKETLKRVRVEVHLSNGKELGPTRPRNLKAGKKRKVTLKAKSRNFDGWSAHPEVGNEEHGKGGEGEHGRRERGERGEHGERERGEHGGEGRGEHEREGRGEHKEGERERDRKER